MRRNMRPLRIPPLLLVCVLLLVPIPTMAEEAGADGTGTNILIAYFSRAQEIYLTDLDGYSAATPRAGNTEIIAHLLAEMTGGDVFEIKTEQVYPVDHSENSEIAGHEKDEDARPVLTSHVENMEQYDIIFLGYPIWWYTAPMAIRTFLDEYDFEGKTIAPYATSLGAGISESENDIANLCPDATILPGQLLTNSQNTDRSQEVAAWLESLEFTVPTE